MADRSLPLPLSSNNADEPIHSISTEPVSQSLSLAITIHQSPPTNSSSSARNGMIARFVRSDGHVLADVAQRSHASPSMDRIDRPERGSASALLCSAPSVTSVPLPSPPPALCHRICASPPVGAASLPMHPALAPPTPPTGGGSATAPPHMLPGSHHRSDRFACSPPRPVKRKRAPLLRPRHCTAPLVFTAPLTPPFNPACMR
ncbi:hypothetical protein ZWY2020_045086 [Hordeum vulgare]|nr:hypothetical protein ZWY2020_045086 [Hordeum vulgare]